MKLPSFLRAGSASASPPGTRPLRGLRVARFIRMVVLAVVLTNLAAMLLGGVTLYRSHQNLEAQARQDTSNLVQVLEQSLGSSARTIDVTLRAVVDEVEVAERERRLREEDVLAMLAKYKTWLPETESIQVFDEWGRPRWLVDGTRPAGVTVADREYFTSLQSDPRRGMHISRPIVSRLSHNAVLPFARRINHPDGSFAGVVLAVVPLDFLTELLSRPSLGPGGTAILRYQDLGLIARHPPVQGPPGAVGNDQVSSELRALMVTGQSGGSYHTSSSSDGVERTLTARRVDGLPFLLQVGVSSDDYLKGWRNDLARSLALLGVFLVVSAGCAWMIGRLYARQWRDSERLLESNVRMESALVDLQDRDRTLRATEQIGGLGVYTIDFVRGTTRESRQFLEVFGVAPGAHFGIEAWTRLIHPDDRDDVVYRFTTGLMKEGRPFDQIYRIVLPDGEVRWIHGLGAVERDEEGQPVSVHGVVQDISARKRVEASLQEALEEYEKLVTRIPVGVYKLHCLPDGNIRFIYVSPRFCEQLGVEELAVMSDPQTVFRTIHEDDREGFYARSRAANESLDSFEWEGRLRVGEALRWVYLQSRPTCLPDGSVLWEGVQSDITDRKQVEIALRTSEERSRLLVQHSPVGILYYDRDLKVSYCNQQFAQIMGVPLAYMQTLDCSKLKDDRVIPGLRAAVEGRFGEYSGPYRTSYAGRDLSISMNCAPVRDEMGTIVGGISILQDITERVRKDEELARYRDSLEDLVAERTADLVAARAEAERLAKVKSEFLANMSHEIRTPLNGVLGMAEIGYRESAGRDKARETFARIVSSGKLLLGVINDILDFSKIEAGKLRIEAIPVNLVKVIGDTLELMEERAQASGLALRFRRTSPLPEAVMTDPLRIGQILLNLLSNAFKFTEQGSVTLTAGEEGGQLVFRVTDTGIGMSAEEISKVFAPFEQADNSTTRKFGGTGLGLTITRRIVELMGGTLQVDSTPGVGSSFEVRLPCVVAAAAPTDVVEAPQGAPGSRLAGLRVLVAEDNEINRLVLEEHLQSEGAVVTLTCNGQEALDCLYARGRDAFDVVLMDVQMPVMDGYAATRNIHGQMPDLPVIGQTAHAFEEERANCMAAGMVDHLAKPIDHDRLVAVILRHMPMAQGKA